MSNLFKNNFASNKKSNDSTNLRKNNYDVTINLKVLIRMLRVLCENGHINRTNLAGKTGLNYNTCIKYIDVLELFCWANTTSDGTSSIFLTEKGLDLLKQFPFFK